MGKSTYFRISLTESCNLNCSFCHNEGQEKPRGMGSYLSAVDVCWMCENAVQAGYRKFKLTGGEPARHPGILQIIAGINALGVDDLSMITNGYKLAKLAGSYRAAGLHRLNVSLYTLNPEKFRKINGGTALTLQRVTEGIDEALRAGFTSLKLNYVWAGSGDLQDFLQVCGFAAERRLTVVLLPLMRFNHAGLEENVGLDELYYLLQALGITAEKTITDAEGIVKKLVTLANGASVLLRTEELKDKFPYAQCRVCTNKTECREGIFPTRLSARAELFPCLADTRHSIPLADAIARRDGGSVINAFTKIRMM